MTNYKLINGNSAEELKKYPDNHFDSVVTDPPYGINFLGKTWDANTGEEEVYRQCLRVLKPGGHLLAFSAARTYHHLAMAVERAGFEIRDQIMWVYGSGFPKSQDVGRSIERTMNKAEGKKNKIAKVVDTTKNAGFGQTDHARVRAGVEWSTPAEEVGQVAITRPEAKQWAGWGTNLKPAHEPIVMARKPVEKSIIANTQKWGTGAINVDGCRVSYTDLGRFPSNVIGEIVEPYQKYFYSPKVSCKERNIGCEDVEIKPIFGNQSGNFGGNMGSKSTPTNNNHPTVKPVALMTYLITLVTPPGGHVLDPFNGSGSTGMAAVVGGWSYTGIDLDPRYIEISRKRIDGWYRHIHRTTYSELFMEE